MKQWNDKYRPKSLKEIRGQDTALIKLQQLVKDKKVVLLHGATGSGKTCAVYALANDLDYEILEVNASDLRNKDAMEKIVGGSLKQQSLFNKGKIILVDEIDGMAGNEDRGGLAALGRLLTDIKQPVVLTANDPWNSKLSSIRRKSKLIDFGKLNYLSIAAVLKRICESENITFDEEDLKTLARRAGGDMRGAINDLQALCEGESELKKDKLNILGEREREESILNAIRLVLKSKNASMVRNAFDHVDADVNEIVLWLEENIGREYSGEDLAHGYDRLSKAVVFNRRILKWQYWRFLVYVYTYLTVGIALAKKEKYPGFVKYERTKRILKIWMANQKYAKRKAIGKDLAPELHTSGKRIVQDVIPYMKIMYQHGVTLDLPLDEEKTEWLKK